MATAKESLIDLECRRKQLEDAVAHLRKSLQHWQTWEAEYEGLKEEILGLGNDPSMENLKAVGVDFGGVLLTELGIQEIKRLLENAGGERRSVGQVVGLLSRRIDYVQDNVKTLFKQLQAAEDRLGALEVVNHPEAQSKEGLPLTEITEELDEDGNVISSSISTPGESSKQVVEALRKAGVKDLPISRPPEGVTPSLPGEATVHNSNKPPDTTYEPKETRNSTEVTEKRQSNLPDSVSKSVDTSEPQRKKVVSFAKDAKVDVLESPTLSHLTTTTKPPPAKHGGILPLDNISRKADIVPDIQDADDAHEYTDGPPAESPEDAALRRQMLQYSMNEVGAIVAEMDLEESDSMTDYSEEPDEELGSETDEEEDQYGRTTRRVISDDYRRQMLELERKLNAQMLENVGPNPDFPALEDVGHRATIAETDSQQEIWSGTEQNKSKAKKGVRFAESLDISEVPPRTASSQLLTNNMSSAPTPIANLIIERAPSNTAKPRTTSSKQRQSEFKTAQETELPPPANQNNPANTYPPNTNTLAPPATTSSQRTTARQAPTGPPGLTIAPTLIERPSLLSSAPPPDEHDPALMQQSLATEYHRLRNRQIQRSGGFLAHEDEEPASTRLDDLSQPPAKRVSLFKRARLG
ncbi:hypothetical protein MMC32_001399 [Xylographa parallela]|nr:hypothetical protein [Xylographa parallela]